MPITVEKTFDESPRSLEFKTDQQLVNTPINVPRETARDISPLAERLYLFKPIVAVLFDAQAAIIGVSSADIWPQLTPDIILAINTHLALRQPVLLPTYRPTKADADNAIEARLRSVIDGDINILAQKDRGFITFDRIDPSNIVYVYMEGACETCMQTQRTLKGMLTTVQRKVPQVKEVRLAPKPSKAGALAKPALDWRSRLALRR